MGLTLGSTLAVVVPLAMAGSVGARAAPTTQSPTSAQPTLPQAVPGVPLTSPVLGGGTAGEARKPLVVRKTVTKVHHRRVARVRHDRYDDALERPALAGVELVQPIPHPIQPPHFTVPVPAYPPENFATFFTTPPPPVICHRVPRDPYAPDPHLFREKTVVCEADNP